MFEIKRVWLQYEEQYEEEIHQIERRRQGKETSPIETYKLRVDNIGNFWQLAKLDYFVVAFSEDEVDELRRQFKVFAGEKRVEVVRLQSHFGCCVGAVTRCMRFAR